MEAFSLIPESIDFLQPVSCCFLSLEAYFLPYYMQGVHREYQME